MATRRRMPKNGDSTFSGRNVPKRVIRPRRVGKRRPMRGSTY